MKFLIALAIAQLLMLSLSLSRISGLEARLEQPALITASAPEPLPAAEPDSNPAQAAPAAPTAALLRHIVRQELDLALSALPAAPAQETPARSWTPDPMEQARKAEQAWLRLDELKAHGAATSAELNDLIGNMAQLEPELGNMLLNELNAAMNRGEIKGRL